MKIVKYPDPILRTVSKPVTLPLSKEDKELLDNMFSYVKENQETAVGLSAVQVGVPKRMCAIRVKIDGKTVAYKLVNPQIISRSSKMIFNAEGCLSVPEDHEENIGRHQSVKVWAYDAISNSKVVIDAKGYLAIILQHEIDHMDGKLYIDYIK